MSRTPARHTQADIARALRAVAQCGEDMEVVLEPDGRIRIVPSQGLPPPQETGHVDGREPEPW